MRYYTRCGDQGEAGLMAAVAESVYLVVAGIPFDLLKEREPW